MIDTIFFKILNMGITAGWLVCALLLFRAAVPKAPKWLRCALWSLVALRLTVPFSIKSYLSRLHSVQPVAQGSGPSAAPSVDTGISVIDHTVNPVLTQYAQNTDIAVLRSGSRISAGAVIWIVGAVVMLIYMAVSYIRLRHRVSRSVRISDGVYVCDELHSPFILGIIRPRIYLPSSIKDENIVSVLAHERAHLARKDHWRKPFGFILLSVYWFNPLIWAAYICLCRDIEFACDEKVIKDLSTDEKAAYSLALLDCSVRSAGITACPLAFGETSVRSRVREVLSYKKPAFWILAVSCILIVAVAVGLMTDPKMTARKVTVNETDYEILSSRDIESSFRTVRAYESSWINELTLRCGSSRDISLDLSGLAKCKEIQIIRIETQGYLKQLVLPEKDIITCFISAPRIGGISGQISEGADMVLSTSPEKISLGDGALVNDISVDEPHDLDFLKSGTYYSVSINSSKGIVPDAQCSIKYLHLKGSDDWDLAPLAGNTSLCYLSVVGGAKDLSPLRYTKIGQIFLAGDFDISQLEGVSDLNTLNVMLTDDISMDLASVTDLRSSGLKYLNIVYSVESGVDLTVINNASEVKEFCSRVPYLAEYAEEFTAFVQNGGEIGTVFIEESPDSDKSFYEQTLFDREDENNDTAEAEVSVLNTFTKTGLVGYSRLEADDGSLSVAVHYFDFDKKTVSTYECVPCGYVVNPILFVLDDKIWLFSDCVFYGGGNLENYGYDHLCYAIDLKTEKVNKYQYDDTVDIGHGLGILFEGNKRYLIVDGITRGTEDDPSYRNSIPNWILDLDILLLTPYDGPVPVTGAQSGHSLEADADAKYIGSNTKGNYYYSRVSTGENYLVEGQWALWCQTAEGEEFIVTDDMFMGRSSKPLIDFQYYASVTEDFILYPGTDWEGSGENWTLKGTSYYSVDLKENTMKMIYSTGVEDPSMLWFRCEYKDYYVFAKNRDPMGVHIFEPQDLLMIKKEDYLIGELNWLSFKQN